ncbi:MAG: hypothetical protein OEV35_04325 [Gallionellaceae bacterium]|nr:hypothetical protein [Gallionellaceae bacterium]
MKSLFFLIFASILVTGCTDTPLIKSSDPAVIEQQQHRAASDTSKAIDPLAFRERTIKCDPARRSINSCYEEADLICTNERLFVSTIFKKVESDIPSVVFKCNTTITYEREDFLAKEKERTSGKPKRRSLMEDLLGVPTSR